MLVPLECSLSLLARVYLKKIAIELVTKPKREKERERERESTV